MYTSRIRARSDDRDKQQERRAQRQLWRDMIKPPAVSLDELPMLATLFLLILFGDRAGLNATQAAAIVLIMYAIAIMVKTALYALNSARSREKNLQKQQ